MDDSKVYEIEAEQELRIECDSESKVKVVLKKGAAEIFGSEIARDVPYEFQDWAFAVFSWRGCSVELSGSYHAYVASETPMTSYINAHGVLQRLRQEEPQGPRVLIVGPTDTGKSTIQTILSSYCAREGGELIICDVDPGQGSIGIPGTLSAAPVARPHNHTDGNDLLAPFTLFYGSTTPSTNKQLYISLVKSLAEAVDARMAVNDAARKGGCIVNTCGWVDGEGYSLLQEVCVAMRADIVLVMDSDRLHADLKKDFGDKAKVVKLPKSGGVVTREGKTRRRARDARIKRYFYGPRGDLCPQQRVVHFSEITILQVGGGQAAPASALPIGAVSTHDPLRLHHVSAGSHLVHSILAVSHAVHEKDVVSTNVAGFVVVTGVRLDEGVLVLLVPCAGPLPGRYLLQGSLKYLE